jgi:hypothetical protein
MDKVSFIGITGGMGGNVVKGFKRTGSNGIIFYIGLGIVDLTDSLSCKLLNHSPK